MYIFVHTLSNNLNGMACVPKLGMIYTIFDVCIRRIINEYDNNNNIGMNLARASIVWYS